MPVVDPIAVKKQSEQAILGAGGKICDWLPHLDADVRTIRPVEEVRARALAMNGLIHLAFKAPVPVVADWIRRNQVEHALSPSERSILARPTAELTSQELIDFHWYLESLWALMWTGGLIVDLPFDQGVPDTMAGLCPNLRKDEDGSKFAKFQLRPYEAVFSKLDLYFRLHWYARDGSLRGYETPPVEMSVVMERRKAPEWVLDPSCDWDSVRDGT